MITGGKLIKKLVIHFQVFVELPFIRVSLPQENLWWILPINIHTSGQRPPTPRTTWTRGKHDFTVLNPLLFFRRRTKQDLVINVSWSSQSSVS